MSGVYRSMIQTGTLLILTGSTTQISVKLTEINNTLRRIEYNNQTNQLSSVSK
jgi:hypothetical protein